MTAMQDRFISAATANTPPNRAQLDASVDIHAATIVLAELIDANVPEGRDKSLSLTHLEDVLMRANRGVFATPAPEATPTEATPAEPAKTEATSKGK